MAKEFSDKTLKVAGGILTAGGLVLSLVSAAVGAKQQERQIAKAVDKAVDQKVTSELVDLVKKNLEDNG